MSWHFSQALVAAYSAANSSDGARCAPSNETNMHGTDSCSDKTTDASSFSPHGTMSAPSMDDHGEAVLTWFLAGFPAKTSARPAAEKASKESAAGSGLKWPESFARWDRTTSSWRTPQCSLLEGLDEFSGTWPRWGMMLAGECFRLPTPSGLEAHRAWITYASGSGSLPTLRASDGERGGRGDLIQALRGNPNSHFRMPTLTVCGNYNRKGVSANSGDGLATVVKRMQTLVADDSVNRAKGKFNSCGEPKLSGQVGGPLNPTWCEWFMGWPMGWTESAALEMDKFQQWCASHGISSAVADKAA